MSARAYTIQFDDPIRGTVHVDIVAMTEADAREDFERRYPTCRLITSYEKPHKQWMKGRS